MKSLTKLFHRKKKRNDELDEWSERISYYYESSKKWLNRYAESLYQLSTMTDDDPHRAEFELARDVAWTQHRLAERMFFSELERAISAVWGEP